MIKVELGQVKKMRGKSEYHFKPAATALGVTVTSYVSPIRNLLEKLIEEGKITMEDVVDIVRGDKSVFKPMTVAEWVDGRAIGKKPGSRPWLGRKNDEDEDNV